MTLVRGNIIASVLLKFDAMKITVILFVTLLAFSCKGKEEKKTEEGPNTINVENVEGSLPDTTAGTTINRPVDTTKKDSLKK